MVGLGLGGCLGWGRGGEVEGGEGWVVLYIL